MEAQPGSSGVTAPPACVWLIPPVLESCLHALPATNVYVSPVACCSSLPALTERRAYMQTCLLWGRRMMMCLCLHYLECGFIVKLLFANKHGRACVRATHTHAHAHTHTHTHTCLQSIGFSGLSHVAPSCPW